MIKSILFAALFLYDLPAGHTQAGQLDPAFGDKGIIKTNIGSHYNYSSSARQVFPQPDGSIYFILEATIITKRLPAGSIDSSYGFNGYSKSLPVTEAFAVIQADGKIVIAGYFSSGLFGITRINTNGLCDSAFGHNGTQNLDINPRSLAIQNDGKIVVAGFFTDADNGTYFGVERFTADGIKDKSFNGTGQTITDFGFKLPPDNEFGDSVPVHSASANSVIIQTDGKIVAGGSVYTGVNIDFAVIRFNGNGSLDTTFDKDGRQTTAVGASDDVGNSLVLQPDGKLLFAGYTYAESSNLFSVVRYTANGSLDKSFSGDGRQTAPLGSDAITGNSVALQKDGKIVLAGYTLNADQNNDFALARFNANGSQDNTFDKDGKLTTDFSASDDYAGFVAIQFDGKIVVSGFAYTYEPGNTLQNFVLARYTSNGSLDPSFGNAGKLRGDYKQSYTQYTSLNIQADGKPVVAGQTWDGSGFSIALARYHNNGSPDSSFNDNGKNITDFGGDSYATSVVTQTDGKIVVAGNSNNQFAVARYNADGSPDNTFATDGKLTTSLGFSDVCRSVALDSSGRMVLAGYSFTDDDYDSAYFAVVRLNADGTLDNTFSQDGKQLTDFGSFKSFANAVAIQKDGKIVVAGRCYLNNSNQFALARYNIDGSPDTSFSNDGKQNNLFGADSYSIQSLTIQNDGKMVVAGYRETQDGSQSSFAIARYQVNGELDNTFSGDGFQTMPSGQYGYGKAVAVNADGRIAVGGTNESFALLFFNSDGSPDTTFSGDGIQVTTPGGGNSSIESVAFADNKLYAAGYGEFPGTLGVVARYLFSQAKDNKAPTVTIITPANNSTYTLPSGVTIKATASDADGSIKNVKFYKGGALVYTDSTLPYSCTLTKLKAGYYSFMAKATDNKGLTSSSAGVVVVVYSELNKAPLVKITSPINNKTYTAPASITLHGSASDSDGSVTDVKFYNGTKLLKIDSTFPYSFTLTKVAAGNYSFTAKATDNAALTSSSASIAVAVSATANKAPVASLTSPARNTVYIAPATITLQAEVGDADGAITAVRFYDGLTLLKTDSASPYNYTLGNVAAGTYSFIAKATDNNGLSGYSASVSVTVLAIPNKAPAVKMVSPEQNAVYTSPSSVKLNAMATDADGTISRVKFYSGATLLATDSVSPYTCVLKGTTPGRYLISATATDNKGLSNFSESISITVLAKAGKAIVDTAVSAKNRFMISAAKTIPEPAVQVTAGNLFTIAPCKSLTLSCTEQKTADSYLSAVERRKRL